MDKRPWILGFRLISVCLLATVILASVNFADAQQSQVYRVGVILPGGALYEAIGGLKDGLKELGLEEGKQFTLTIRDTKGDPKEIGRASCRERV